MLTKLKIADVKGWRYQEAMKKVITLFGGEVYQRTDADTCAIYILAYPNNANLYSADQVMAMADCRFDEFWIETIDGKEYFRGWWD